MKMLLLCGVLALGAIGYADDAGYRVIKKIPLGGEGRWDYLTVDNAARRLYVSRGTHVSVVDLEAGKLAGDILGTAGVHGIALAPEFNRGFISCGQVGQVMIFDLKTLLVLGRVETGKNPDAILYDPASKLVFAFNGGSQNATVFVAATGEVKATIPLGGKPEFSRSDEKGKVYVNIEDTSEVVEIDSQKLTVTKRYPLAPGEEPSGMGLDNQNHRIFSGCNNQLMTVLDIETGKLLGTVPIGKGVDGNGFDPETKTAFSSNGGDGTLTVVQETAPGKYAAVATVKTQPGSRTMTIDPKTHNVYLPCVDYPPAAEAKPGEAKSRPAAIKDSFAILVVGK